MKKLETTQNMLKKLVLITPKKNPTPIKVRKPKFTKTVKIKHVILLNLLYKKFKRTYTMKP